MLVPVVLLVPESLWANFVREHGTLPGYWAVGAPVEADARSIAREVDMVGHAARARALGRKPALPLPPVVVSAEVLAELAAAGPAAPIGGESAASVRAAKLAKLKVDGGGV
jgi:hypothetical protein